MLRVLTFNTWFLRTPVLDLAKDIDERLELLPQAIANSQADIVFLQECWSPKIRQQLVETLKSKGLKYCAFTKDFEHSKLPMADAKGPGAMRPIQKSYVNALNCFPGGNWGATFVSAGLTAVNAVRSWMGNGLMTFSKYPLSQNVNTLAFSHYTRPDEFMVQKGAIHVSCEVPGLGVVDLYNSHIGAVTYQAKTQGFNVNECKRRNHQIAELNSWIDKTKSSGISFLGADLNVHMNKFESGKYLPELSEEYIAVTKTFEDPARYFLPTTIELCSTDSMSNPYKADGHFGDSPDAVLDYILSTPSKKIRPECASRVFSPERTAANYLALSDHFGVTTDYSIH